MAVRVPSGDVARVERGRDITRGYVDSLLWLPPQDSVLNRYGGGDYELYEQLLRDDRVLSAYQQRFAALIDRETEVVAGGESALEKMAAEHMQEAIEALDWDTLTEQMLYGVHYGFSVAEVIWGTDGGYVVPKQIHVRNRRRFHWKAAQEGSGRSMERKRWELRLRTVEDAAEGELMPDRKFWTLRTGADNSDEPYGRGLAHQLYWPVWFKRNQTEFWLVALEKFGMPHVLGKHLPNATVEEKATLLAAAKSIRADSAAVVPNTDLIELIESAGRGTMDFESFYRAMDSAITTVILSETMTLEDGSSRSQAEVHRQVQKEVIGNDAWIVSESFRRTVGTWMTEWNFPGAAVPRVQRVLDDPPDLEALAKRDKTIHDMGFRPTKKYIEETYNIKVEEQPEPTMLPGMPATGDGDGPEAAAELAAQERARVEQVMAAIDAEAWDEMAAPMIEPVLRRARQEPERFLGDLASVWPDMNATELADRLARVLFVAFVWGRLQTEEEER